MRNVIGTPTTLPPQMQHPTAHRSPRPIRGAMRPRRTVEEPCVAFREEPITPLPDRLRVDLEPLRSRLDRPTVIKNANDHPTPTLRRQRRVRMLTPSVGHEPS